MLPDYIINKGEEKEGSTVVGIWTLLKEEDNNIVSIEPQCDCMSYEKIYSIPSLNNDVVISYKFWFDAKPVGLDKESYDTEKLIVVKYKNDDMQFVKIRATIVKND